MYLLKYWLKTFFKLLWFAIKGLLQKPYNTGKINIFAVGMLMFFVVALFLAGRVKSVILAFLVRWIWIPLSVLLLLFLLRGEIKKRKNFKQFFELMKFEAYDGATPDYVETVPFNEHLEKAVFRSQIPEEKWDKIKPDLSEAYEKKVYDIKEIGRAHV